MGFNGVHYLCAGLGSLGIAQAAEENMKILFVAMPNSVHALRWINQVSDLGWDIHLFPSVDVGCILPEFHDITVHHSIYSPQPDLQPSVKERGLRIGIPLVRRRFSGFFWNWARFFKMLRERQNPDYRVVALRRTIKQIKPDIVHSIEFQYAGYLTLPIKEELGGEFPIWIATNYGSDLHLFGRLREHREKVKAILQLCDYYDCECERDVEIARQLGLRGKVVRPMLPNAGGFNLEEFELARRKEPISARRQIILKGYQHFAGRSLFALRAMAQCVDVLQGYKIVVYSAQPDVEIAIELFQQETGLEVELLPHLSHDKMLEQFGQSRIYIGLSISDAISTSMLEAMTMGAFPIQSNTACSGEWVVDGESALIVPPEDIDEIAQAIRLAMTDDELVDQAAQINLQTARERLDMKQIKPQIAQLYEKIHNESK